jgi:hypothetical protein
MDDPKCRKRTLDTIRNYHRGVSSLTDTGELFVGPVLDVTGTRERERERERRYAERCYGCTWNRFKASPVEICLFEKKGPISYLLSFFFFPPPSLSFSLARSSLPFPSLLLRPIAHDARMFMRARSYTRGTLKKGSRGHSMAAVPHLKDGYSSGFVATTKEPLTKGRRGPSFAP